MHFLGYYFGLSKQTEVLLLTLIGICFTVFDKSLIYLNSNLRKVWDMSMDPISFSTASQTYIKYILSGVVVVRSFTVHLYLAFYIVMLWPAIFEERPGLLLPWLLVGAVKNILMSGVTLILGMYTCAFSNFHKSACAEFFCAQFVDYAPSFYMWFSVFSYYRELKAVTTVYMIPETKQTSSDNDEIVLRRRKIRSMTKNSDLRRHIALDEQRHLISVSTIENLVQQLTMQLPKNSRSLDTLLTSMAAEAALISVNEDTRSEVIGETLQIKAKKFLKLTDSDITSAKLRKDSNESDLFSESMLLVCELDDELTALLAKTKQISTTSDCLKSTHSEKQSSNTKSKLVVSSDVLSDISEIEIRPVLNYSTTSLSTVKGALSLSDKVIQKKIVPKIPDISKTLIPVRVPQVQTPISVYYTDAGNQVENPLNRMCNVVQFPSHDKVPESSQTCDFTCQASTLSRNILKLKKLEFLKNIGYKPQLISGGYSTNNPNKHSIGLQKNLMCSDKPEHSRRKCETSNFVPFKTDGYTVAYLTKMRKTKSVQPHTDV